MTARSRTIRPAGLMMAGALALGLSAAPTPAVAEVAYTALAPGDITGAMPRPALAAMAGLKRALAAVDNRDLADALSLAAPLPRFERDLVTWIAIRRGLSGFTPQQITEFAARNPHWPTVSLMRRRAEQALAKSTLTPLQVAAAFASAKPISDEGHLALVRAYIALGRTADASRLLADRWTTDVLTPGEDAALLKEFGALLTTEHHKARFALLLAEDRLAQAATLARQLGEGHVAVAAARTAVLRGTRDAAAKIAAVPKELRSDPAYAFTVAEWHRRNDRPREAAEALLSVPAEATAGAGDEWWIERRIVSRDLLEAGDAALAYRLVAAHKGGDVETLQEAHFHAGWYALRFLKQPDVAIAHFEALQKITGKPISRSRAAYWLGRADEAAGRIDAARAHFEVAASDEIAFYGQLARVKLGRSSLDLPALSEPTEIDRAGFAQNDLARMLVVLTEAGYPGETGLLYPELARQLPSAGQLTLLSQFVERRGNHRLALQIGKIAADRGLGVERLAFPLEAIPESARALTSVETAMVYAIARQESAFDPAAVSQAGALGLLQLLPGTAAATAKKIGVSFTRGRLTTDPGYNAQLGAAHLAELVEAFDGSYILTFAAYNAGKGRALEWIRRFGDPRDPAVDPIDWIERIPFGETRNYVQRVMENVQVYRERLGQPTLAIADDLRRGS